MSGEVAAERITLSVPIEGAQLVTARAFVSALGRHYELSHESTEDLKLIVSEICAEAIERWGSGRVRIEVAHEDPDLVFEVRGEGEADDDLGHPGPDEQRRRLVEALIPDAVDGDWDRLNVRFRLPAASS